MKAKSEKETNHNLLRAAQRRLLTAKPILGETTKQCQKGAGLWCKPFHSDALGVNPNQIEEATKALRADGVMADFAPDGKLIVTSDKQFKAAAKSCGLWSGRDGYGGGMDEEGRRVGTGRENEMRKREFREAIARGDYNL